MHKLLQKKRKDDVLDTVLKKHLDINRYSRSAIPLERKTGIVIHYTDSATNTFSRDVNWLYEFLNTTRPAQEKFASYHYAIDQDGKRYEFIPPTECAWHAGPTSDTAAEVMDVLGGRPNWSTIGVAFLHPTPDGKPTEKTQKALIELVSDLIVEHNIPALHIFRHHDCTGKMCPRYFVENEQEWVNLKRSIYSRVHQKKTRNTGGLVE